MFIQLRIRQFIRNFDLTKQLAATDPEPGFPRLIQGVPENFGMAR
jgi:hypothetical protein